MMLLCATTALLTAGCLFGLGGGGKIKAKVTNTSGQSYDVAPLRLSNGPALKIVCGEMRMNVPIKQLKAMKVYPSRISSVDGRPHYGVEMELRNGTKIGGDAGGDCVVCADNGFVGKSSKAAYSAPLSGVSSVEALVKADSKQEAKQGEGEEDGESEE